MRDRHVSPSLLIAGWAVRDTADDRIREAVGASRD